MYGTVSSQSAGQKASSVAALCGVAAVVAVAGLVGLNSQPSSLYSATAVRPAVQTAVGSVPMVAAQNAARIPMAPASAVRVASEEANFVPVQQSSVTLWPVALGVTAVTALVSILLRKKSEPMLPIAMAATSGERPVWFPGATPAAHLTGQYPGDRGFDPLGFSKEPKAYERMRIAEVINGRWAMLGVVGCLVPELFFHKAAWFEPGVDWYKFGAISLQCIAPVEYWRGNGGFSWKGDDAGLDRTYPGFDPLGITSEDTKLREIKNGRLAMLAMAGFEVQYHITGQSPLANLWAHWADPWHNNVFTGMGAVAMFAASGKKERKLWFPGGYAPSYLTGEYPADYGFDVFGLAQDPKIFERMRISEVFHGRLAMLAVVGAVVPEVHGISTWYDAPAAAGWGVPQIGTAILACGVPELLRGQGGSEQKRSYPGFDPLNLTTDYTKEAEIKNGRLAMLAIAGFFVQHLVTKESPLKNYLDHYRHPLDFNIAASLAHPVAMFASTGHKDGLWFPGATPPKHLDGSAPGDRGFDPLSLAVDPEQYERLRIAEVFNGRCAMLGVVGSILPELLGKGPWFDLPDSVDATRVSLIGLLIAAPTEYWRGNGGFGWEKGTRDRTYPGFDPLKLTNDRNKAAEVKNGRLAMTAMLGFEVQRVLTGQSPLANLSSHLADPLHNNITANIVAMFASTGHKDGVWFPGAQPPAWLDGSYPADRGFDPLALAKKPEDYAKYRDSEVFHGRWAMLGLIGCLVPDLMERMGLAHFAEPIWFKTGGTVFEDAAIDYLGNPNLIHAKNAALIAFTTLLFMGPVEAWRWNGSISSTSSKGTHERTTYPGFDPLKLTTDYTKAAEIKNGRLAMVAMFGFWTQAYVTGKSPIDNLTDHLADPFHNNITSIAMLATGGEKWYGRGVWFPGAKPPSWLDGTHPGDRGFDPAGMSADPKMYERMRAAEVFNGRVAMLAVVGALFPEMIGRNAWFDLPADFDAARAAVITLQVAAPLEYWRANGGFGWNGEKEGRDRVYPGFDPLGITNYGTKTGEVKNGRLAMIAMLGFEVQSHVTHKGPWQNLLDHLADPVGQNFAANVANGYPWGVQDQIAMFASSGHKDGVWFPGVTPAPHLDGTYPGDRGFDPLRLSADPEVYERMRVAEIFNGRLAMFGVAGSLIPEILGKGPWFSPPSEVNGYELGFWVMLIAAPTEYWRGNGGFGWEKGTADRIYPGFDPLKLANERNKTAEIKNGRLAMTAMLGLELQRVATHESPLANLAAHLADPLHVNAAFRDVSSLAMF